MPRAPKNNVLVGTSGWTYDSWPGPFYPGEMPKRDWLACYGSRFASTEVNGSFYRTPSLQAVQEWRRCTPANFVFAWKASKFITHWKRLKATCANSISLMETRLKILGPKAGPVLFQLPANFEADRGRLEQFLEMLPARRPYAFEFRHPSWYDDAIFELLANKNVSLCLADHYLAPAPWVATARHVYIRGHGPTGRYRDNYPPTILRRWAQRIGAWLAENRAVYVYFDNDQKSAAPADAAHLIEALRERLTKGPASRRREGDRVPRPRRHSIAC